MRTDWLDMALLEVCDAYQPKTIGRKDMNPTGRYPVFGANGIIGRYDQYNHEDPEVILGCRGTCGAVNVSEPKSWVTGNAMVVRPKDAELNRGFLKYFLLGAANFSGVITGVAQPQITRKSLSQVRIRFPRNLSEQKRIVAILDEAFAGIDAAVANAEKNLVNARELFESYLNAVFTQRGEEWVEKTLGECCTLYQGFAINKKTKKYLVDHSPLPLLRIKDLRNGSAEQYVAESGFPKNALVNTDDIIYTRTGQIGLVFRGRSGVLHNNCFKIVPSDELERDFLYWWLQEPSFRSTITRLASRAAQPDITHKLFKAQTIAFPPLQLQKQISQHAEMLAGYCERLSVAYRAKVEELDRLRQAILHKAFTGELTAQPEQSFCEATV